MLYLPVQFAIPPLENGAVVLKENNLLGAFLCNHQLRRSVILFPSKDVIAFSDFSGRVNRSKGRGDTDKSVALQGTG